MLYIIGIGINEFESLPLGSMEILRNSDIVYVERFTGFISDEFVEATCTNSLQNTSASKSRIDIEIKFIKRWFIEDGREILDNAQKSHVCVLVYGDPLVATTYNELLISVPDSAIYSVLILMPVISRWAMVYAVFNYPYAREQGMGKSLKEGSGLVVPVMASISAVIIAALVGGWQGVLIMVLVWLITVALSRFFRGKFQGLTGDSYGTINEFSEFAVLLLVVLFSFNNWF